jgi:hypothetical protein
MEAIIGSFYNIPYFRHFLNEKYPVRRSPVYEVKLKNGVIAYGIAIGDDPQAVNMTGKHASVRAIEECQFYPKFAFVQFQGTEAQTGSVDRYIGVPDGRVDTPFRELDNDEENNRLHLSRRFNPDLTTGKLVKLAKLYGGEAGGDFQNQIDGIWGEPVASGWDLKAIKDCMILNQKHPDYSAYVVNIHRKHFETAKEESGVFLYNLPFKGDVKAYFISIDPGYSQPSVILVNADYDGTFQLLARINLRDRMTNPQQTSILKFIFGEYDRRAPTYLAIDCTDGEGRSLADTTEKQINPKRIYRVEFQSTVVTRIDEDEEGNLKEHKETIKEVTALVLRDLFCIKVKDQPAYLMPYDTEILEEFGAERRQRDSYGNSRLITPNDIHIPESMRCFAYLVWQFNKKKKLEKGDTANEFVLPAWGNTPVVLRRGDV